MWKFISAARLAQIKADARAEGYIKAVREGIAASDAVKEAKQGQQIREPYAGNLRTVTSGNTQTQGKTVQEVQNGVERVQKKRRAVKGRMIERPWEVEAIIMKMCGESTYGAISAFITKHYGEVVMGKRSLIMMSEKTVERIVKRELRYNPNTGRFVNYRSH